VLSYIKSSGVYAFIRKLKYRINRRKFRNDERLSIKDMRVILEDSLGLREGSVVMIHCGFGFLNAEFSPQDLIVLLKNVVGRSGVIMMPFYPPGLSSDWLKSGRVFDPETVKCSTGVLAQCFAKEPDVTISSHPIKAVAVWGERAEELAAEHQLSDYPYGKDSPYYRMAMIKDSISIGLGVRNCSTVHCAEDVFELDKSYLYSENKVEARVVSNGDAVNVETYFHHGAQKLISPAKYFEKHCDDVVSVYEKRKVIYYAVDNGSLMSQMKELLSNSINRVA
jgi:aminoglycoside N3'-acetyltransferase